MKKSKHSAFGKRLITSAREMVAHAKGDLKLDVQTVHVPPQVDVAGIRKRLKLSQTGFARRFGFNPRSVQDWEQGRRKPESAARAYLVVIAREHKAVDRALRGAA
jgi:putative transcriptional regulator